MKKNYIIYGLIFITLAALFVYEYSRPKSADWTPHLNAKSDSPYGQKILINHLNDVFDSVEVTRKDFFATAMRFEPGDSYIYPLAGTERTRSARPLQYNYEEDAGIIYEPLDTVFIEDKHQPIEESGESTVPTDMHSYVESESYERLTLNSKAKNSAYIITNLHFSVDETDFFSLFTYTGEGRTILIATEKFSEELALNFQLTQEVQRLPFPDSMKNLPGTKKRELKVNQHYRDLFSKEKYEVAEGLSLTYFQLDENCVADTVLTMEGGLPVVIAYACGKGKIYLCSMPLLFTNYGILHDNRELINELMVLLPQNKVYWDDYYKTHRRKFSKQFGKYQRGDGYVRTYSRDNKGGRNGSGGYGDGDRNINNRENPYTRKNTLPEEEEEDDDRSILSFITGNASLSWAWYTLLFTIALYMISSARRRQRIIPVVKKLQNTTVEFVQMISRLYYLKKDHKDIAVKKINYFQEYLRAKYYHKDLSVNDQNIEQLANRSNKESGQVRALLELIYEVQNAGTVSELKLHLLSQRINEFKS